MLRPITLVVLACGLAAASPDLTARAIKVEVSGAATLITAAMGSDQGVEKTMRCSFVDDAGKALAGDCVIVRIDHRTTLVKTTATADPIRVSLRVRFTQG